MSGGIATAAPLVPADLDLDAYRRRIGFSGGLAPTRECLVALIAHHAAALPFENVEVLARRVPRLDLAGLTDKLVHRRRGGYCYEQNGLMGHVLAEIGFRVRRLAGRVVWMLPPDAPLGAQTHTVLAVTFPGSQGSYLVDVGFGGQTLTSPIRFETGNAQETTHEPYRLNDRGDGLVLQALVRGEWKPLYAFGTQTVPQVDLAVGSWYVSTHPASIFVTGLTAALTTEDARYNLAGRNLSIHRADGSEKIRLDDAAAVVDVLGERFGIDVAGIGERSALEARIGQVLDV